VVKLMPWSLNMKTRSQMACCQPFCIPTFMTPGTGSSSWTWSVETRKQPQNGRIVAFSHLPQHPLQNPGWWILGSAAKDLPQNNPVSNTGCSILKKSQNPFQTTALVLYEMPFRWSSTKKISTHQPLSRETLVMRQT
jgi:hypothetical protein